MKAGFLVRSRLLWVAAWIVGSVLPGCSSSTPVKNPASQDNLMKIGTAYVRFNEQYRRGPSSAEELLPFLKEVGDPAELLRSPDDHEPYVVCWGVDLRTPPTGSPEFSVLAYEQRGSGGQRFVMSTSRWVGRKSDAEFRKLAFPSGFQPSS